jgi:hypothetical protein
MPANSIFQKKYAAALAQRGRIVGLRYEKKAA